MHRLTGCSCCSALYQEPALQTSTQHSHYTHSQTVYSLHEEHQSGWYCANTDAEYMLTHRLCFACFSVVSRTAQRAAHHKHRHRVHAHSQAVTDVHVGCGGPAARVATSSEDMSCKVSMTLIMCDANKVTTSCLARSV